MQIRTGYRTPNFSKFRVQENTVKYGETFIKAI